MFALNWPIECYPFRCFISTSKPTLRDFPGGPVGKTPLSQCRRPGFYLWSGNQIPVLLPGKSHGWRNLVGYGPWGCKQSETTERLHYLYHYAGMAFISYHQLSTIKLTLYVCLISISVFSLLWSSSQIFKKYLSDIIAQSIKSFKTLFISNLCVPVVEQESVQFSCSVMSDYL